ncbi:hypothetical protein [Pedobacter roseus]|uniref:Uncharacterized protein n=1 Tax=Pedobacter roseus TaxID=336820 RepID=A0A7G9QCW3_9SPHI|nr:hypothetical protein [Pedobacter roseus]QNN41188.1 hypothetical protein H9L23_19015 [Pedobacter roseus]
MKKLIYLTLLFSLIIINGCKKEQILSDKSTVNEIKDLSIAKNSQNYLTVLASTFDPQPFNDLSPTDIQNLDESQATLLLEPTVESGTVLYNNLVDQVVGTQEWNTLTYEEKAYILNFTPQQKAMLAVLYDAANNSAGGDPRWVSCAAAALGFNTAYGLFVSAFKVGMSAETAIAALRFVGLKYLGYIGLAYAIYQFIECVRSSVTSPSQSIVGIIPAAPLPIPSTSDIFYQADYNLLGQFIPHRYTSIFLNSLNNKYYIDNGFISFVPDGYYDSQSELVNNLHKYYHIVDGSVIEILLVTVDPNG